MRWWEIEASAPELAALAVERFARTGVAMLGTLRGDGSPRISPCEVYAVDGELCLGMMWRSRKALDLLRDPRIVVHSATCSRAGDEGDVKLYGVAVEVGDPVLRERYADTLERAIDWRPPEPFHLFALDVRRAGFISFGEARRALRWTPERGLEAIRHPDDPTSG